MNYTTTQGWGVQPAGVPAEGHGADDEQDVDPEEAGKTFTEENLDFRLRTHADDVKETPRQDDVKDHRRGDEQPTFSEFSDGCFQ